MSLPDKHRTFYFDAVSHSGEQFKGDFTITCKLSIRERHMMELDKTRILGGNSQPTNALMGIATMVAMLSAHIIKSPKWWSESNGGMDLEDEDIVVELYDRVITEQLKWRDALVKETLKVSEEVVKAKEADGETPLPNG